MPLEHLSLVTREAALLGPIGHHLFKTTLSRPRNIIYIPNKEKQTQRFRLNEETKECLPRKEQDKTSEK